jgi:hypothetical protein
LNQTIQHDFQYYLIDYGQARLPGNSSTKVIDIAPAATAFPGTSTPPWRSLVSLPINIQVILIPDGMPTIAYTDRPRPNLRRAQAFSVL